VRYAVRQWNTTPDNAAALLSCQSSNYRTPVLAQWIGDLLALVVAFVSTRSLKMSQFEPEWCLS
jgi:hypothetical protein